MTEECTCPRLPFTDEHGLECPTSLYQVGIRRGRAEERARIVTMMRTDYPMNQHAREWADWIEKLTDWPSDGTCRQCGAAPRSGETGLCVTCEDEKKLSPTGKEKP